MSTAAPEFTGQSVRVTAPTPADYASLGRAGEALHRRGWRKPYTVNEVVDDWRAVGVVRGRLVEAWNPA